jgi:hypothetical protein
VTADARCDLIAARFIDMSQCPQNPLIGEFVSSHLEGKSGYGVKHRT